jgi:hypothetical protein
MEGRRAESCGKHECIRGSVHKALGFAKGRFRFGFKGKLAAVFTAGAIRKHCEDFIKFQRPLVSVFGHIFTSEVYFKS